MRHAVLGGGGIGGLLAGALARSSADVLLLLRPETLTRYGGRLAIESAVLGRFEVEVPAASLLDREVDVVWVATKATELESALSLAPAQRVGQALVVPLLNGVDHVRILRNRYQRVAGAAIRVESERVSGFRVQQTSPFLQVELADADAVAEELRRAGIDCLVRDDELSLLWEKLVFLAPIALVTSALDVPLGIARDDPRFADCVEEALAAATAEGACIDADTLRILHSVAPAAMRSSMQKDVAAGRQPELDAIGGPILRAGERHGIATVSTAELVDQVRARTSARAR
jgi:2-dehydropantoate 2-reductase